MLEDNKPFIITISGDLGGGKSVLADRLVKHYSADRYSTGTVQRQLAEEKGITTLQLNQLAETDKSIDDQIDGVFKSLEDNPKNLVVDSRMAWHFLPKSFKIKLEVAPQIAAERISKDNTRIGEGDTSPDVILQSLLDRKASEVERFKRYYNVDISDRDNYTLAVNSYSVTPDEIAAVVCECVEKWRKGEEHPHHWVSATSLLPTQSFTSAEAEDAASVTLFLKDSMYYIIEGHNLVAEAVKSGTAMIPASVTTQAQNVQKDDALIQEWQDRLNFTFERLPSF